MRRFVAREVLRRVQTVNTRPIEPSSLARKSGCPARDRRCAWAPTVVALLQTSPPMNAGKSSVRGANGIAAPEPSNRHLTPQNRGSIGGPVTSLSYFSTSPSRCS